MASQKNTKLEWLNSFFTQFLEYSCFDATPWASAALANLSSKRQKLALSKKVFFFTHWHQGKECYTILIAPTVESYPGNLAQCKSTRSWSSACDAVHTSMTPLCFYFFAFWGVFYVFEDAISR